MKSSCFKLILIPILVLVGLISVVATFFIVQEVTMDKRARTYVNYVKERYNGRFSASVEVDDKEKTFLCEYEGPNTIASFDEIRVISNEFLSSDKVGQSFKGYRIYIMAVGGNSGPVLSILSNEILENDGKIHLDEELISVSICGLAGFVNKVSEMDGLFDNIRYLSLSNVILDEVAVLRKMDDLETVEIANQYTEEDLALVREALPDCEIIYRYEALERGVPQRP